MGNEIYSTTRMNTRATPATPVAGGLVELIAALRHGRVMLKSGGFVGVDLMRAWCAMAEAAEALGGGVEADDATVERVARTLCELRLRMIRRHDTLPAKLEAMIPAAVDYSWPNHCDEASAAIAAVAAMKGQTNAD